MLDQFFQSDVLFFTIPALLGTAVFLLKMGLMTIGGAGGDLDLDLDTDVDVDVHPGDATGSFNLLSLQSMASMLMGFGWGGLIGLFVFEWGPVSSAGAGIVFAAVLLWLLAMVMRLIMSAQSSGNVNIRDAAGKEGDVYAEVPARGDGRGQVRVILNGRARIYNAVTEGEAISTGTRCRVTAVNADNSLSVIRA